MAFTLRLGNVLGKSIRRIVCTGLVSLLTVAMLSACDDRSPPGAISPTSPDKPEPNIHFIGAADLSDESKTSLAEVIERIQAGVVQITVGTSSGSGFIIDADGLVITNDHVVGEERSVGVRLINGRFYEADVLERDATADLALVQIDSNDRFHAIAVGDPDGVRVGDEVLALGFPLADRIGNSLTVTRGIISSTRIVDGVDLLQTDAAINPGNSGGPLVDIEGAVIGVNTSRIEETDSGRPVNSIGFAVSVIELERRLPTLNARRVSNPVTTTPTPTSTTRPVDIAPIFTSSVADVDYTAGTAVSTPTLPAAAGGNGTLIYSLTPAIPGLSFDTQTRQLTGTPTSPGTYSMTYGVTDADDNTKDVDADTISFTITVAPDTAPSFTGRVSDLDYTAGTEVSRLTLPAATGGNGPLIYSLTPTVPGLRFSPETRQLTGTPMSPGTYSMTYGVMDADGNTADIDADTISFTITVIAPDSAPSFSDGVSNLDYTVGKAISGLILPAATGGNGALTYFLTPAVPGLTFVQATRQLMGTPTAAGTYNMTYRVTDADGDSTEIDADIIWFTITVLVSAIDYDVDGDGLIEIANLEQLNAIRWDPDGDGAVGRGSEGKAYAAVFPNPAPGMGCPSRCIGYELTRNLDFDRDDSYASGVVNQDWRTGTGWEPIGGESHHTRFAATLDGNSHTIFNLYIDRSDAVYGRRFPYTGLFGYTGNRSAIRRIGLASVDVSGSFAIGALVGRNGGMISASFANGIIRGEYYSAGGLVGHNEGSIITSYARIQVSSRAAVGGPVGTNDGTISASYARGDVSGSLVKVGGLVGEVVSGSITACYATGTVSAGGSMRKKVHYYIEGGKAIVVTGEEGSRLKNAARLINYGVPPDDIATSYRAGGLAGTNDGTITASYWNTDTSGMTSGVGAGIATGVVGKTTAELQTPTGYTGIYSSWNIDVDGDGNADDIWDFGTPSEYPGLKLE